MRVHITIVLLLLGLLPLIALALLSCNGNVEDSTEKDTGWRYSDVTEVAPGDIKRGGVVGLDTGPYGYIDKTGAVVILPQFVRASRFSEGLAAVVIHGKCVYIDKTGKVVLVPDRYYMAYHFSEGLAAAEELTDDGGGWFYGYIDKAGKTVIEPKFYWAGPFSEGLAPAIEYKEKTDEGKSGYIDKKGNWVIKPQYDRASSLFEKLARVKVGEKYGFIDRSGKMVIEPKYEGTLNFSEGVAKVYIGDTCAYIGTSGNVVLRTKYRAAGSFCEGLAGVVIDTGFGLEHGYIDKTGKVVIPPDFDLALDFSEGLAAAKVYDGGGKWGYINKKGEWAIKPTSDWIVHPDSDSGNFSEGLAAVDFTPKLLSEHKKPK